MVYDSIRQKAERGQKGLAVLIDPDSSTRETLQALIPIVNDSQADWVFVGGSFVQDHDFDICMEIVQKESSKPVVLFPGDSDQVDQRADAILLLSLISGRNPDFLIGKHVEAAFRLYSSGLEIIPTGYMVLDGGRQTSVLDKSGTRPLPQSDLSLIKSTALAGEQLGLKIIYLDAGSGAETPVRKEVIHSLKQTLSVPLIVGGGIRNVDQLHQSFDAGADVLVVGNAFERDPELLHTFQKTKNPNTVGINRHIE